MLLELTGDGSIDGPVAGVVRPHGQFVHEQAASSVEHLHREYAGHVELGRDLEGDLPGPTQQRQRAGQEPEP